jgi:RNA polymerase sigma-70 factor (ECF subfamily)
VKDESELLANIRNGALDDFAEIIQLHQQFVFTILHRYERDTHLVEDLAQETFLKAWRSLHQFDGRAPFGHWLSRIAVHVALDHLRRQRRAKNQISLSDLGESALEWLHNDADEAELQGREAREILDFALRKLSPEEQLVITLQEIEGKSVKEIARLTGWSGVGVRVRAHRARGKLRKVLLEMEKAK